MGTVGGHIMGIDKLGFAVSFGGKILDVELVARSGNRGGEPP